MTPQENVAALQKWVRDLEHLPPALRDFHDQKDFFKSLHEWMAKGNAKGSGDPLPNWVSGHIYVIDWFLRFAALHGWTLQRSRKPLNFASLDETVRERRDREAEIFNAELKKSRRPSTQLSAQDDVIVGS